MLYMIQLDYILFMNMGMLNTCMSYGVLYQVLLVKSLMQVLTSTCMPIEPYIRSSEMFMFNLCYREICYVLQWGVIREIEKAKGIQR